MLNEKDPEMGKRLILFERDIDLDKSKIYEYHVHQVELNSINDVQFKFINLANGFVLTVPKDQSHNWIWTEVDDFVYKFFNKLGEFKK